MSISSSFVGVKSKPTMAFDVELKRRGKTFHVPIGETILEVLLKNDVYVSHSCREGVRLMRDARARRRA